MNFKKVLFKELDNSIDGEIAKLSGVKAPTLSIYDQETKDPVPRIGLKPDALATSQLYPSSSLSTNVQPSDPDSKSSEKICAFAPNITRRKAILNSSIFLFIL